MKKIICMFMTVTLLMGALVSCGAPVQETETNASTVQGDTVNETETLVVLEVPETHYDGEELCFLTREDGNDWSTVEIFAENQTTSSDNISTAVFERNDRIFQAYGVTVVELRQVTSQHGVTITNEVYAPTGDIQALVSATSECASMASKGYLWNLKSDDVEYMDFTKPWWDSNMAEGLSFNDKLYFATGDLLTTDNDATFVLLFNKEIVKDCGLPDLYELVENNRWTMDRMYEFEQIAVQDKDGDGTLTYNNDICGFAYTSDSPLSLLIGGGVTLCTKDEVDYPVYDLDIERAQGISDMGKLLFSKDYAVDMNNTGDGVGIEEVGRVAFGEGHALFMGEVMQLVTRLRGYDVDFGILPYPMFTEQQGDYYSVMHSYASASVAIPKSVVGDELVMVDSMIEAMAYHSMDTLTEQYYEINLKTKGAKDEKSGPMMDKILSGRVYDPSYYYTWGNNVIGSMAECLLPGSRKQIASLHKGAQNSIKKAIEKMAKAMDSFD